MNSPLRAAVRYAWLGWRNDFIETLTGYGIDEHRAAALASWVALNTQERGGKLSECLRECNDLVAFGGGTHVEFAEAQLEEQSRRRADFRLSLRAAARGIWTGQLSANAARNTMLLAIHRRYTNAWHEGMRRVGLKPEDMTVVEAMALNTAILSAGRHVTRFVAWAEMRTRADGVLLRTLWPRVETWINGYDAIVNRAAVMAGKDGPLEWRLGVAEHCLAGDTIIRTNRGDMPIKHVVVTDSVWTRVGWRLVYRVHSNPFDGAMLEIAIGGHKIQCTPNHRFMTRDGWQRADRLSIGQEIVCYQDAADSLQGHIGLPDASNGVAAGGQVGILGFVSSLLRKLPISQWLKTRVAMPVVAVRLNDEIAHPHVNNELGLDDGMIFIGDSELVHQGAKQDFQFGRLRLFPFLPRPCKLYIHFLAMVRQPLLDLGSHLGSLHRVVFRHISLSAARTFGNRLFPSQLAAVPISDSANSMNAMDSKLSSNRFGKLCFVKARDFLFLLGRKAQEMANPLFIGEEPPTLNRTGFLQPVTPTNAVLLERSTADGAGNSRQSSGLVAANRTTETSDSRTAWDDVPRKRRFTELTNERLKCHDSSLLHYNSILSITKGPVKSTKVYNLTVAGEPEYIANGILIHNCNSCLKLDGKVKRASWWTENNVLPRVPGAPWLACKGWRCQCGLFPTDKPLSRGRMPKLP